MLTKISLRNQVKKYLQQQMLNGKISFGERISMPSLAEKLEVSVTPIREALTQLQQVNIVEAIPNRGFFLPELNKKESSNDIEKIEKIQAKIETSSSPRTTVTLDLKFHDTLLQNYDNSILKNILDDLKIRVFLYEFHYMQEEELAKLSTTYHQKTIKHLKKGEINKAADSIKESWLTSIDFIKDQFNTKP